MPATEAIFLLSGETVPVDAQVAHYEAREALSELFRVDVEFWTLDEAFDIEKTIGKPMLLQVVDEVGESRFFHGVVGEAEFVDVDEGTDGPRFRFRVRLVPFLDALQHREGCKIFQDKTTIHVVREVFEEAGIPAEQVEWQLYNDYEPREYIVQYRESELNFVHRLFEDEGIFYYFKHTPDGHKLIVGDDAEAFQKDDTAPMVMFALSQGLGLLGNVSPIEEFSRTRSVRNTSVLLLDFDFEKPQNPASGDQNAEDAVPLSFYEWPGGFIKSKEGKRRALARMRALRRDADVCRGKSRAIGLRLGVPFAVEGADQEYCNGDFVVTSLVSRGVQTAGTDVENFACRNEFEGIPVGAPWAPPRRAHRPRIRGVHTAIVTGTASEEETIHCDKYGRIKVRFYWDRIGQHDDKATCWMRVVQLNTGGTMILPRLGWEVAIAFMEGDPDRPFVLGRLYNAERTPPYALPGASASGSLKTGSSPGGAGNNEIKMSDTGGSQGFGITAQKDLNINIGHDKGEKVAVDETHQVTVNMKRNVGSNEKLTVGGNQDVTVGANHQQKIGGAQTVTVGGNESNNAISNYVEHIGASRTYTVGGNYTHICNSITTEAQAGITRNVSAVHLVATPSSVMDNIGAAFTENVGAVKLQVAKGTIAEAIGAAKTQTTAAAEIHLIKGKLQTQAALMNVLVGGIHYQNVAGDYTVKAPMITLVGATGAFKGGGSTLKLGGGPIVAKGSKISIKAATIIKMGTSLKMGSG